MYIVIHSLDPYLLARMATDLQLEGMEYNPVLWNADPFGEFGNGNDPIDSNRIDVNQEWMLVNDTDEPYNTFCFYDHRGCGNPTRFTLTSSNYLEVLDFVINNKDK